MADDRNPQSGNQRDSDEIGRASDEDRDIASEADDEFDDADDVDDEDEEDVDEGTM